VATVEYEGHRHELGTVDVRLDEGIVIVYDTHHYIIATIPVADIEEKS
jgi:hypothetical protein